MEGGVAESLEKSSPTSQSEGESLGSAGRTTEDLYSVYLHGMSQQRSLPQQPRSVLAATCDPGSYSNTTLLHAATNNAVDYQNFARGYQTFYSLGFQQHPSPRHQALVGDLQGNPLPALQPSRAPKIAGIPNANNVSGGGGSIYVGESSAQGTARNKRRMISRGNMNIQGENLMAFDTPCERYTLYDNKYEEIGLPTDPHIRAFLANNANGNHVGRSTSNT